MSSSTSSFLINRGYQNIIEQDDEQIEQLISKLDTILDNLDKISNEDSQQAKKKIKLPQGTNKETDDVDASQRKKLVESCREPMRGLIKIIQDKDNIINEWSEQIGNLRREEAEIMKINHQYREQIEKIKRTHDPEEAARLLWTPYDLLNLDSTSSSSDRNMLSINGEDDEVVRNRKRELGRALFHVWDQQRQLNQMKEEIEKMKEAELMIGMNRQLITDNVFYRQRLLDSEDLEPLERWYLQLMELDEPTSEFTNEMETEKAEDPKIKMANELIDYIIDKAISLCTNPNISVLRSLSERNRYCFQLFYQEEVQDSQMGIGNLLRFSTMYKGRTIQIRIFGKNQWSDIRGVSLKTAKPRDYSFSSDVYIGDMLMGKEDLLMRRHPKEFIERLWITIANCSKI